MASVVFRTTLKDKEAIQIPSEVWEQLDLPVGEEVSIIIQSPQSTPEPLLQEEYHQRLDAFRQKIQAESSTRQPFKPKTPRNAVKRGFAEAMDEKFERLGFVLPQEPED